MLPKPGVMDPVAQSALAAIADFGIAGRGGPHARKYWLGGLLGEQACDCSARSAGQRRHRAGGRRPAAVDRLEVGSPYEFELVTVPIRELDDEALDAAQPRGAAVSVAGRDADDPGPFPPARPRPDRRRAGDDRPDLERALQPQDAGRPDRLSRTSTASGSSRTCSRKRSSPPRSRSASELGDDDWCVSVFRGQRRRGPLRRPVQRRLQGRNAQSPLGPGALRRGQYRHRRRDSRSAGHRHGRQADLQHRRLLLRPARHAGRSAAARRAASRAG